MRARGWWIGGGAAAIVVALAVGAVAWSAVPRTPGGAVPPPASVSVAGAASGGSAVCGFPGALVSKITATRAADQQQPSLRTWTVDGEGSVGGLAVAGNRIVVLRFGDGADAVLQRYDLDGRAQGSTSIRIPRTNASDDHDNGRWAISPDGSVYTIDSYDGHRALMVFSPDGQQRASYDIPRSDESTDHPLDLQGVTWIDDLHGAPALLVGEGTHTIHGFRPDGTSLGELSGLPDVVVAAVDDSRVFGMSEGPGKTSSLRVVSAGDGTTTMQAPVSTAEVPYGRSTTGPTGRVGAVVPAPGGDGFVVTTTSSVDWVDPLGVRRGVWLSGQNGDPDISQPAAMVQRDGTYWLLVNQDGHDEVAVLTSDELAARLVEPVSPNAGIERTLAQLGIGLGAVTDQPFNHFDDGTAPAVALRAEAGWGQDVPGAENYQVHYTVSGDPTSPSPVFQDDRTVSIPRGGGEVPLELPAPRPGVYEVSLSVVDTRTGAPVSGSCLRYSIGSAGTPLDLGDLAKGEDWGGAGPLRGAQLADRLGVGSHRVQLEFGSLVPSPTSTPSPESVNWQALPGATDADPFADLRAAGAYAAAHGVTLAVQLGRGGDAEEAAVDAGTWAGWAGIIVARFALQVPQITHWEAWNEPNMAFDSGADYVQRVEIPFADAAHAAAPASVVLGGNTLGLAEGWWAQAVGAGVCAHIDAVAVHPYTGWNRSWEEEGFSQPGAGFDALRSAIGPDCAALPLWDTESGWTADGASAFWAQGSNVARKLLWYEQEGVAGWTYFFSEGGWGENDLSWSLVQYGAYLKPGALAMAEVSRLLAGRGVPETIETGIPFTHAMRIPGDDTLVAVWTDEARLDAVVTTDASSLTTTDQYGAVSPTTLDGGRARVTLTASPQFFRAPAGATLSFSAPEPFGPDLLAGQKVTASSTHQDADPQVITSGTADPFRPWRSGSLEGGQVDESPAVTVALPKATTIDRIAVATGNIACCEAGLRHYTVSVQTADQQWHAVAEPTAQFWERTAVFTFDPVDAVAVRVEVPWTTIRDTKVLDVNYTGFSGGLPPPFMGLATASDYVVSISAIQAFAPAR